jgi:hypothetical protein
VQFAKAQRSGGGFGGKGGPGGAGGPGGLKGFMAGGGLLVTLAIGGFAINQSIFNGKSRSASYQLIDHLGEADVDWVINDSRRRTPSDQVYPVSDISRLTLIASPHSFRKAHRFSPNLSLD